RARLWQEASARHALSVSDHSRDRRRAPAPTKTGGRIADRGDSTKRRQTALLLDSLVGRRWRRRIFLLSKTGGITGARSAVVWNSFTGRSIHRNRTHGRALPRTT